MKPGVHDCLVLQGEGSVGHLPSAKLVQAFAHTGKTLETEQSTE